MNILQVVEACFAGVGRHVRGLCRDLSSQGHRLTVAYSPYRTDGMFRRFMANHQNDIRFIPLGIRRPISPVSDLRGVIQLLRFMELEGPFDIVHGHSSKGGGIARLAGRWAGVPTVYTPNGLLVASPEVSRFKVAAYAEIERLLGHWATAKIIAVSEGERELVLKLVPKERVELIENGINDEDFELLSKRTTSQGLSQQPLTFGSTMRFSAQKAPDHLIEAFIQMHYALPQEVSTRLVIAGDGEVFDKVRKKVETSGLMEKISLLGWRENAKDVLRALDVFVLPSLYEGLSYAVLEAMAAGLPIVSTAVFGTRETVSKVQGNVVVPVGDPAALADGMKQIATLSVPGSIRQVLQSIGHANHDYARVYFRQSKTTGRTLQVYKDCICEHTSRPQVRKS